MLDDVYSLFDQVCRNHGICKVGTVGDAYIATGINYPVHRSVFEINGDLTAWNQAVQIAKMAREFLARIKTLNIPEIGHALSVRIGIHKGNALRIPVLEHCSWHWSSSRPCRFRSKWMVLDLRSLLARGIQLAINWSRLLHSTKSTNLRRARSKRLVPRRITFSKM